MGNLLLSNINREIFALIDDEDVERVSQYKWYLDNFGYVRRNRKYKNRIADNLPIKLSVFIFGKKDNMFIDHINGDKLDNRKSNLRYCTMIENNFNREKRKDNTSGYKGIHLWKGRNGKTKWMVRVAENNTRHYYGLFNDLNKAIKVYNDACKLHHGEFAVINKV